MKRREERKKERKKGEGTRRRIFSTSTTRQADGFRSIFLPGICRFLSGKIARRLFYSRRAKRKFVPTLIETTHTRTHATRASFFFSAKSGEKLSSRYLFSNRGFKRHVYLGREFIYSEVSISD